MSTSSLFSHKAASLTVTPQTELAGELLDIKVEGLGPGEPMTLRASAVIYRGRLFHSLAHYKADSCGGLDLARDRALGGDFTGVELMELLCSLTPVGLEDPCLRQMPRGVMKKPLRVEVTVHRTSRQPAVPLGPALASAQVQRWFSTPELLRACQDFATLALPFFGYKDLPPIMKDLELDYIIPLRRQLNLCSHSKVSGIAEGNGLQTNSLGREQNKVVKGPNTGVTGSGKGAELAFSMASFLANGASVVSINGYVSNTATAIRCAYQESHVPLEKANTHFLFIIGEDDRHWKSSVYADIAVKHLTEHGKTNFTFLSYPNASHKIDPPYSPFFSVALDPVLHVPILGGGQFKDHAIAQIVLEEDLAVFALASRVKANKLDSYI
ncbi:acyl-coenzyme A thioesterase 1-like [Trichechus manatus latirostris]|uniref:Acyl-coenzyme A thioesterase 1-like n=1 Tax=Trichechus manatus latirostris TaxID=127582 RepID=A0A2Y9QRM9_TRIMA|nr:acyl-coenzyme A thioesterase 1-like [Trichechus manatus latirostris]